MNSPSWFFVALFCLQTGSTLSLNCHFCRQSQTITKAPFSTDSDQKNLRCAANATDSIKCAAGIRYCETRISADLNAKGHFYVEKLCGKIPDETLTFNRVYGQNCTPSVVYDETANGGSRLSKRRCFCESDHCNKDRDIKMVSKSAVRISAGVLYSVITIFMAKIFILL